MLYSGTRVKMNYDIFFMIYVLQIIYDSYLLHVYILLGRIDWHRYRTKFNVTRGGRRAFYKPTTRVLRSLTQNMQTTVWTSSRGLIAGQVHYLPGQGGV